MNSKVKYYLALDRDEYGKSTKYEDGWLYKKTPNGKFRIQALFLNEFEHPFHDRKQLLKDHGFDGLQEEGYDQKNRPNDAIPISAAKAKSLIKKWKAAAKELWPDTWNK